MSSTPQRTRLLGVVTLFTLLVAIPLATMRSPSMARAASSKAAGAKAALAPSTAPLLPGEQLWNGVPSYLFGMGDTTDYGGNGFRDNPTIQAHVKAAHVPVIRTFIERVNEADHITPIPDSTNLAIAQTIANTGAQCIANLTQDTDMSTSADVQAAVTWDLHMVSILSPYCKYFEVTNEPDLGSGNWPPAITEPNYMQLWNSFVPQARAQTPGVYFGGPVLASEMGLDDPNYMQNFLSDAAASGVAPDFVSYHWYMCGGISTSTCLTDVDQWAPVNGQTVYGWIQSDFPGKSIPLGITEWNMDPGNPASQYDDTFMSQYEQHALAGFEKNPYLSFANQFTIASSAGYGSLDMFRTSNPESSSNDYTNTPTTIGDPRPMWYVYQEELGRNKTGVPHYGHVIFIPEENHGYSQIVGSSSAPYINNTLIPGGALATNYFANVASSLPNYLIWEGGSDLGLTNNCEPGPGCESSGPTIASEAEASGQTWGGYEENSTANCQNVVDGGTGGLYTVHHDPFPYYTSLTDCNTNDVNFSNFAATLGSPDTLPNYVFLGPNLDDEMHNGTISQGDTWLSNEIPAIQNSTACSQSSCLIMVAFDESFDASNEQVMAAFTGPDVPPGTQASTYHDHYALTHTEELALGELPTMQSGDANAAPMTDMFGSYLGSSTPPPAPVVSSFSPTSGPVGTVVTVSGSGFTGATSVTFNGVAGTNLSVASDSSLSVTVPSSATTGPIAVTTPNGTGTSSSSFTVSSGTPPPSAPVISSFSPTSGAVGTSVTVNGSGFTGATSVTFNGVAGTNLVVGSDAQLAVTVPSGATTGPIAVTTPNGTGTSSSNFTVTTGGGSTTFTIVEHHSDAASGTVTSLNATLPSGVTQGNLLLVSAGEGSNLAAITPPAGWSVAYNQTSGGQPVSSGIFYKYVDSATAGQSSWTFTLGSAHSLVLNTMEVNATYGWQSTLLDRVQSNDQTATSSTALSTGTTAATTNTPDFVLANFSIHSGAQTWSGLSSGFTQVDDGVDGSGVDSMDAWSAPGSTGTQSAAVTASTSGYSLNGIAAFAAVGGSANPVPSVSSFSPTSASVGTDITINGSNFTGATDVTFNGTSAPGYAVNSDSQITVAVPSGATTGPICVVNANGSGCSASNFTVTAPPPPAPTISGFSPAEGDVGTSVTISGANFTGASAVAFNGTAAASYTVDSDAQITAVVPSGATSGTISVTTAGGTATSSSAFTVYASFACAEYYNNAQDVGTCDGVFDSPAVSGETSCVVIQNGAMVAGSCKGTFAP